MTAVGIYIYMLRCADGSYYVGSATGHDLSTRIDQHNTGSYPGYTFSRRPVVLVWSEYFDRITDGIAAERQIKGWSRARRKRSFVLTGRLSANFPAVARVRRRVAEHPSFEARKGSHLRMTVEPLRGPPCLGRWINGFVV